MKGSIVLRSLAAGLCGLILSGCGSGGELKELRQENEVLRRQVAQLTEEKEAAGLQPADGSSDGKSDSVDLPLSHMTEENAAARRAYAAALERILREQILPDGSDHSGDGDSNLEENQFSVCDVDGDGAEELILLYTTTITAGHRGLVCSWEGSSGALDIQLEAYPVLTFYESGAVQAGWSHNQGKGGSFWPYDLYRYDDFSDTYVSVGSVDAWDASLPIEGYPSWADQSKTGFVYYIAANGSTTGEEPLDASIYEAWRYPYVRSGRELRPEYLPLTAENIQSLLAAG